MVGILESLRAVVLLDGSPRRRLAAAVQRSLLDLPVGAGTTIGDLWLAEWEALADAIRGGPLMCRIVVDQRSPLPHFRSAAGNVSVSVERDPEPLRGSGGVLHDVGRDYGDDDYLLVISGVQAPVTRLTTAVEMLADAGADVALAALRDGEDAGIQLIRCGCLRRISPFGYVDFKEMALAAIQQEFEVRGVEFDRPVGHTVRTAEKYLAALRYWHLERALGSLSDTRLAEDCWPIFAIVEPGAVVASDAEVVESVVLRGGIVEAGASVVRSIVCPGQKVGAGCTLHGGRVVERVLSAAPRARVRNDGPEANCSG